MSGFGFRVEATCPRSAARAGLFRTPHGEVKTPAFMPVGTRGTVKGLQVEDLERSGTQMILANTYHLALRPGADVVRELGGLHRFTGWSGPILTDSGGYQIFSLRHLCAIDEEGVTVRSVVDGSKLRLTPAGTMALERALGADVIMALDHCPPDPTDREGVEDAAGRTTRWLERCVRAWREAGGLESGQALFGIVQGGAFDDARRRSAEAVTAQDLPGYAIGGVGLGEDRRLLVQAVGATAPLLPADRPRYLMGVGLPGDLLDAVERGVDLFDCVAPTRHGRNHQAFTSHGRVNLRNRRFRSDPAALDSECDGPCCARYSRGYLRHLARSNEILASVLLSLHNLRFYHRLLAEARAAIPAGTLTELRGRIARTVSE